MRAFWLVWLCAIGNAAHAPPLETVFDCVRWHAPVYQSRVDSEERSFGYALCAEYGYQAKWPDGPLYQ